MLVSIIDPVNQTYIFIGLFVATLFISLKKISASSFLTRSCTTELKGFAMLAVIFSHIGYFLVSDTRFLYPLSIFAGAGVNIFLLLSGYGLTLASLEEKQSILGFYKKRLPKLFIPLWIILPIFLLLDYLLLAKSYPPSSIINSFLGLYPRADLFTNINSPLWYFTIIFFYYLIFPLFFQKPWRIFSPLLMIIFSYLLLQLPLPVHPDLQKLYSLHFIAFPLGIFLALVKQNSPNSNVYQTFNWIKLFWGKIKQINQNLWQFPLLILLFLLGYFAINSHVGDKAYIEQSTSILLTLLAIIIFSLKKIEFRLFSLFGIYSYELYLLHWPILSRYEIFYKYLPPFLATILYLALFLGLGYILQKASNFLLQTFLTKKVS